VVIDQGKHWRPQDYQTTPTTSLLPPPLQKQKNSNIVIGIKGRFNQFHFDHDVTYCGRKGTS
jgi:hypothetical protein